jgi:biopolymer transport protein ExbD
MAGGASDQEDESITGINVTPLVDITLVLLIIFMVTASYIVKETIEIELPRAAHGGETVQKTFAVPRPKARTCRPSSAPTRTRPTAA